MCVLDHQESDVQSSFYAVECEKDVQTNCFKIVTDKRQNKLSESIVWPITPLPKGAIFSLWKRWMVWTGLKRHKIMRKPRFQHLKALFIHFTQFCRPWITHKKWHSNKVRLSFKNDKKSLLVTSSTIFFLLFHLAVGRQRCPNNLG